MSVLTGLKVSTTLSCSRPLDPRNESVRGYETRRAIELGITAGQDKVHARLSFASRETSTTPPLSWRDVERKYSRTDLDYQESMVKGARSW